jgi:biopolymer transport protein ExbD
MWLRITHPDFLIYLQVSYANTLRRRNLNWTEAEYEEQLHRLRHARENANLIVETDDLTPEQVIQFVLDALQKHGFSLDPSAR